MSAKRHALPEKLLRNHEKIGECWIWLGAPARKGYGAVSMGRGKTMQVHRLSYQTFVGPIPEGALICHKCNTPLCINPAHLYAGTQRDNARDREAARRAKC
jgi:HNH endonuclease